MVTVMLVTMMLVMMMIMSHGDGDEEDTRRQGEAEKGSTREIDNEETSVR